MIDPSLYPPLENSTTRITITWTDQILCTYCKLHTIPQEDWYKVLHQKLLSNLLNHRWDKLFCCLKWSLFLLYLQHLDLLQPHQLKWMKNNYCNYLDICSVRPKPGFGKPRLNFSIGPLRFLIQEEALIKGRNTSTKVS